MSYLPPEKRKPSDGPSPARIAIWVAAGGVGLYFLVSGLIGILTG